MGKIVEKENVVCTVIIGYGFHEREVNLVWVDTGKLGISVVYGKDEKPFLIEIDPDLEHAERDRASALITGAMALMMLWLPPSKDAFSRCFDVANVMVFWDTDAEREEKLLELIGPTATALVMKEGWPQAEKLNARILSESDRAKILDVCRLYFEVPESVARH